jgi:Uma2 family endonuclease
MATSTVLIPVEEYLRTVYRPDCDYIDGEVLERNMGEKPHSRLQGFFMRYFAPFEDEGDFETLTEQRVKISERRYRIPDVALVRLNAEEPLIVASPPILCIEILSSKDRMRRIQERIDDYASLGVDTSWVIDPWHRVASAAGPDAILHEVTDRLTVPNTPISITVPEIFAELDRLEARAKRIR